MALPNSVPYPVLPRGLVYSTTNPFAAKFWNIVLKPTLYMECGPPWISMSSGYLRDGSNLGGFTIHPCTRAPPDEVYQISSTSPRATFCSTSSFTRVSRVTSPGFRASKRTTSPGSRAVLRTPTPTPPRDRELSVSTCAPRVTGRTPPPWSGAK
jgi:hypothetical protein